MQNYIIKCEKCGDVLLLSDIVGQARLADATSWQAQHELWNEWVEAIKEYHLSHICKN